MSQRLTAYCSHIAVPHFSRCARIAKRIEISNTGLQPVMPTASGGALPLRICPPPLSVCRNTVSIGAEAARYVDRQKVALYPLSTIRDAALRARSTVLILY